MNRQGYSILEAVVAMTLFAIGIMALTQSYYGIVHAQVNARNHETGLQLARERLESVINAVNYDDITSANYPSEDYGAVEGGDAAYSHFSRSVAIAESLNAGGMSVLKEVDVVVSWETASGVRSVSLNSVIAKRGKLSL